MTQAGFCPRSVTADEAETLFSPLANASGIVLAVSGGADSTAMMVLVAEWAKTRHGPPLFAATIDHGLRPGSRAEAEQVGLRAAELGVKHEILDWQGCKPSSGIEEAAREARYALLASCAARHGASHLVTAHTEDDQAETILMRLASGSGPGGLAGMRAFSPRGGLVHARPLLGIPKSRLIATLRERGIGWSEDGMNADPRFARPRLRAARAVLEEEGLSTSRLAVLAGRMARQNDALDRIALTAWSEAAREESGTIVLDGPRLIALPEEIALRLLIRAVSEMGTRDADRLAKAERLLVAVLEALGTGKTLSRTLSGAKITVGGGKIVIRRAPARRGTAPVKPS